MPSLGLAERVGRWSVGGGFELDFDNSTARYRNFIYSRGDYFYCLLFPFRVGRMNVEERFLLHLDVSFKDATKETGIETGSFGRIKVDVGLILA